MNDYCRNEKPYCYFHPKEILIGVCPLCLTERLLILAAKQRHHSSSKRPTQNFIHKKPPIRFPKIFDFGFFLNRLEFRHTKTDHSDHDASTSQEDSFISIKFEDNGVGSWEKKKVNNSNNNKVLLENCNMPNNTLSKGNKETKSVIEHTKPRSSLRWRKRIGHLLQLIKWRRSNKANVCHVGNNKVEGVKVRKGWIKTLTKRRNKE